ncbi:MAG: hypothetical protein J7L12_04950 [Desulfurococcales archaeon]|nr:hypothetical protein [Desulfurococcales archaeon]
MNGGGFLDKNNKAKGRFIRELMLELNLKSFTGRVLINGRTPEGTITLRIHLRDGLPTYCFLSIEGGVLTGSKCVEVISEIFCIDCEVSLERASSTELLVDEDLVAVQTKISQLGVGGEVRSLLLNPLTQLLLIRLSSSSRILHGKLSEIFEQLKEMSLGRTVIAFIKGSNFDAILVYRSARLVNGALTRHTMNEQSDRSSAEEVVVDESLGRIEQEYGSEVVVCTAYVIESKFKLKEGGRKGSQL